MSIQITFADLQTNIKISSSEELSSNKSQGSLTQIKLGFLRNFEKSHGISPPSRTYGS